MPTIAHLSDVHLHPIAGFTPRHWSLKRALGYANFVRTRRASFDAACAAGRDSGRPVFLFHMMGRLDQRFC